MNVNSSRPTNTPTLLLLIIFACLGLLIIGVPVQAAAQPARADVRRSDEAPAKIEQLLNSKVFISPLAGFFADLGKLISVEHYALDGNQATGDEPVKIYYQNDRALVQRDELLVVTHLARAGIPS